MWSWTNQHTRAKHKTYHFSTTATHLHCKIRSQYICRGTETKSDVAPNWIELGRAAIEYTKGEPFLSFYLKSICVRAKIISDSICPSVKFLQQWVRDFVLNNNFRGHCDWPTIFQVDKMAGIIGTMTAQARIRRARKKVFCICTSHHSGCICILIFG